jgi:hypothetical protein
MNDAYCDKTMKLVSDPQQLFLLLEVPTIKNIQAQFNSECRS